MSSTETSPASNAGSFPLSVTPTALQTVQSPHPPGPPGSSELPPGVMAGLIIGIGIGGIAMLVLVCIFVVFYKRWKRKKRKQPPLQIHNSRGSPKDSIKVHDQQLQMKPSPLADPESAMLPSPTSPFPELVSSSTSETSLTASSEDSEKQLPQLSPPKIVCGLSQSTFTYEVLAMATNDFSDANLLGQGGFGYVHKGVLPDGKVVAIKQLKDGSKQGEREFQAEVEVIGRIHHRHLVSLVGYCICGNQRMLVYDFVANGTLEFHLHGQPRIIHRDIKASNILLDNNFEAKVADFGLAKCHLDTDTHVSTRVLGTFGYLAPEYASSGRLTDKSDVFSFGVVLLELITGQHPVDVTQPFLNDGMVDWARPLLNQALGSGNFDAVIDSRLQNDYDSNEITRMIACAAACVRHSARLRPQMSQVVRALEGNMPLGDLGDGIAPGQSTDYDISQYKEDLAKFRKLVLENQEPGTSWSYESSSEA